MNKDSDPLTTKNIKFLLSVYQTGKIATAGQIHGLSAAAASRLLDRFRKYFQDPLFVVSKGTLFPTTLFLSKLPAFHKWIELSSELRVKPFDPKECKRRFRFSCFPSFATDLVAFILPILLKEAPMASIEHIGVRPSPLNALMSGQIDLLIGRAKGLPPQAHYKELQIGKRCVLLRKSHPLIKLATTRGVDARLLSSYKRVSLCSGRNQIWVSPDNGLVEDKNHEILFKTDRAEVAWKAMTKIDLIQIVTEKGASLATQLYSDLTTVPIVDESLSSSPSMAIIWSDTTHRDAEFQWFRKLFFQWATSRSEGSDDSMQ